jgi:hypothetical protein
LATLLQGNFAPRQVPPQCINILNFRYEDGFKTKNKYFPEISMVLYLSNKTIRRTPQTHETIPLIREKKHRTNTSYGEFDLLLTV